MRISKFGICAAAALFLYLSLGAQSFSQYEKLKDPQISKKPNQKMLIVEAKGDPSVVAKDAFGKLFNTFFKLPGVKMAPPRGRWLGDLTGPKEDWVGLYALPLPESVTSLPADMEGVKIEEWEYGEVAEILHIGAYSEETPTIEKLNAFIRKKYKHGEGLVFIPQTRGMRSPAHMKRNTSKGPVWSPILPITGPSSVIKS